MKWRIAILAVFGIVLLAGSSVAGLAYWLVRTEGGTRWVLERVTAEAGAALEISSFAGTLAEGLSLTGMRFESDGFALTADRLTLRVTLSELFARRLVIEELAAGAVEIVQRAEAPAAPLVDEPATAFTGFSSPFAVELQRATIESLRITAPGFETSFGATSLTGALEGSEVRIAGLQTSTRDVALNGDLELDLSDSVRAMAELTWSTEIDGIAWAGSGSVAGDMAAVEIEHRLDSPFTSTAVGDVAFGDAPRAELDIEWVDLSWPGEDRVTSPSASLQLAGWLDAVDFSGAGSVLILNVPVEFEAAGDATREFVTFDSASLRTDFGSADVSGVVSLLRSGLDLAFDATDLDPQPWLPDWPASVDARGRLQGSLEPALSWTLEDLEVEGVVRERPLSASGTVSSPAAGEWLIDSVEVDWSGSQASMTGSVGQSLDLSLRVDAPALEALFEDLSGRLAFEGRVTGNRDLPAVRGSLEAAALRAGGFSLDLLQVEGSVAAAQQAQIDVTFQAEGLRRDTLIAGTLTGRFDGTTAAHTIGFDLTHGIGSGALVGTGGWNGAEWNGEIASVDVNQDLLGVWSLEAPTGISVSSESLAIDNGCLRNASARLCAGVTVGGGNERLAVSLESFNLAALQPLLGEAVTLTGLYDAELDLVGPRDRPTGGLSVLGQSTLISISDVEAPLEIPVDRVSLNATLTETELRTRAELRAPAGAQVDLDAVLADIWTAEPLISASLDGSWSDLQFVSILSPDIGDVSGVATVSVDVTGPLSAPDARGEARWTGGQIEVPRWGMIVRDIDALVSSPSGTELEYSITGIAGDGSLMLTGRTELNPEASWPTSLRLTGNNLAALQLPEAEVVVSPDFEVRTDWPTVFVSGTVAIPSAALRLDQAAGQSTTISSDVVVHGIEAGEGQRPLDMQADIQLVLGNDVRFSGSGLNAELSGAIDIDYRSGQDAIASGTVTLAGDYTTLGQTLDLEQGRLLFAGPVTNPGLDVRGVRRFETLSGEVVAGVLVTGTVRQPVTRLFSEPSMSEGDIVSYLVIGRPISDSSRENSEALQTAALSLGLTQALPQIQHFGEAIGLDELGIRTSAANTGELMAGKQVSPRVYMRYTYGLINRIGGLLLRFRLTDQLRLETRTGAFKAMDLLYTVERE